MYQKLQKALSNSKQSSTKYFPMHSAQWKNNYDFSDQTTLLTFFMLFSNLSSKHGVGCDVELSENFRCSGDF